MDIAQGEYELDINPKKVCRLCLSQASNLVNIFSNSIVDGYIISVPEMLTFTVDVTVRPDDNMPGKICGECKCQIITFYTFKQKTKRTEQSLLSMFNSEGTNKKDEITTTNEDDRGIICELCDISFENEFIFIEHVQSDHNDLYEIDVSPLKSANKVNENDVIEQFQFVAMSEESNIIAASPGRIVELVPDWEDELPKSKVSSRSVTVKKAMQTRKTKQKMPMKAVTKSKLAAKPSTSQQIVTTKTEPAVEYNVDDYDEADDNGGYQVAYDDQNASLIYDKQTSESLAAYECPLCCAQFSKEDDYIKHCLSHENYCDACNETFIDENQLLQHECETTEKSCDSDLWCAPCNKRLKSSTQLKQHVKMHESMSVIINYIDFYPCHDCCIIFITKNKLIEHNATAHPSKRGSDAIYDDVTFDGMDNDDDDDPLKKIDETCTDYQFLDDHKQAEYKDLAYSCGDCSASYATATELKYHVILHAQKFPCPIYECGCQYDQLSRLSIHVLNKHINTKHLKCLHCNDSFRTYDELQAHLKNSCKEKKFECPECDKKFFSKKALVTHLRTLTDKKFKCDYCEKKFKQRGELAIHKRSHTNERPFQCTICGKAYKTSSMRAAHMDSHITGKTFACTYGTCNQTLQSRTSYRNHMKRHTDKKKHKCDQCGKLFFTRYHLKLHASKVHKNIMLKLEQADENDKIDIDERPYTDQGLPADFKLHIF